MAADLLYVTCVAVVGHLRMGLAAVKRWHAK
jgi:hypothetical protein